MSKCHTYKCCSIEIQYTITFEAKEKDPIQPAVIAVKMLKKSQFHLAFVLTQFVIVNANRKI